MKKVLQYICLLVGLGTIGQGCYQEDKLTPTGEEPVLSEKDLPQGEGQKDERIMAYFRDYNLLTFYRFSDKEFWWTPTRDIRPKPLAGKEGGTAGGYEGTPAEEAFVDELVQLLDDEFFAYYSREYLDHRMPKKFLLMSELFHVPSSALNLDEAPRYRVYVHAGYDRIAINMANEDILKMTDDSIRAFRNELHAAFLTWQTDFKFIVPSPAFLSVTTYGTSYTDASSAAIKSRYKDGVINIKSTIPIYDWKEYLTAIVSHSYAELTGKIDPKAFKPGTTVLDKDLYKSADPHLGMLNPDATTGWDSGKKIRQKYDILITYFKETYGLDLQAIGDGKKRF